LPIESYGKEGVEANEWAGANSIKQSVIKNERYRQQDAADTVQKELVYFRFL
jgi:hypothetical protein